MTTYAYSNRQTRYMRRKFFYIDSKGGGVPWRLKIRSPSFCNLSILPKVCVGAMVPDVVSILGSLDFVMGECDR